MPGKLDPLSAPYHAFVVGPEGAAFERLCAQIERALAGKERPDAKIDHWETAEVGPIPEEIREKITRCDVLLADIRGHNPNVIYEVGLAHGIDRQVVFFADAGEAPPFDIAVHRRLEVADNGETIDSDHALRDDIQNAVRSGLRARTLRPRQPDHSDAKSEVEDASRLWERLASQGHLQHLEVDALRTGARVIHLDEGLGRITAFTADPAAASVTVLFRTGIRMGFELRDPELFQGFIERA